jgi:hypothetical protein
MAPIIHSIIDYEPLKIFKVYKSTCFGMWCPRLVNMQKMMIFFLVRLRNVNVKKTHNGLEKTITCTKKFRKGRWEWEWACFKNGMRHWKLKTPMKTRFTSKVIIFEKALEFKNAIIFCYGRQKSIVS